MLSQTLPVKVLRCTIHKNENVTHVCSDLESQNNPLLCSKCLNQNSYLYHKRQVLPFEEAASKLSSTIRTHIEPMTKMFKSTIGKSEYSGIYEHVQKGENLYKQLDQRILFIKQHVQLQLQLLQKQFQKILLSEKQEYFRTLEDYQKAFKQNIDHIREKTEPLLVYQQSFKYYSNENNMLLKMIAEGRKKTDWLKKSKKMISNASKILENSRKMSDSIVGILNSAIKNRLDLLPTWKGEEIMEKGGELRYAVKRALNQWVYVPQIKNFDSAENGRNHTFNGMYHAEINIFDEENENIRNNRQNLYEYQ